MKSLTERLKAIESLENELLHKSQLIIPPGAPFSSIDFFLIGAMKRTVSQSRGFRILVESWNFSCATILVRMQIDTAMRINGIPLLANPEIDVKSIFDGEIMFWKLKSKNGKQMTDAYLRKQLSKKYSWVKQLYKETSGFVHLSFRHLWPSLVRINDEDQMAYFFVSDEDPKHNEANYYEVVDAFIKVSKMTSTLLLALLIARHRSEEILERYGPTET